MDWFLHDRDLRHEKIKVNNENSKKIVKSRQS